MVWYRIVANHQMAHLYSKFKVKTSGTILRGARWLHWCNELAWFGGNYVNYFKSGLSIGGSTNLDGYMLTVKGDVRARKVRVDNDAWPDYVFAGYL